MSLFTASFALFCHPRMDIKIDWVNDTGASDHMTPNKSLFISTKVLKKPIIVHLPDGTSKTVIIVGKVQLTPNLILTDVFYVPEFQLNLLSVGKLIQTNNLTAHFYPNDCMFQDPSTKEIVVVGKVSRCLYICKPTTDKAAFSESISEFTKSHKQSFLIVCFNKTAFSNSVYKQSIDVQIFHARLGHSSVSKLVHIPVCSTMDLTNFSCECCILSKIHRLPFQLSQSKSAIAFELIYMDLWGPYKKPALNGTHYFFTIVDDHTRATWTYLVHAKSQISIVISSFLAYIETHFQAKPKCIRSDNRTEIVNNTARSIRLYANLPIQFWRDCILAATYLINKMPMKKLQWKSTYEVLYKKPPTFDHLRVIGCLSYVAVTRPHKDKFDNRGIKCVLIGYPQNQTGYKLYNLVTKKVFLSRDVVFDEQVFPFKDTNPTYSNGIFSMPTFADEPFEEELSPLLNTPLPPDSSTPTPTTHNPSVSNTPEPTTHDPLDPNAHTQIPSATVHTGNGPTQTRKSTRQFAKPSWLMDFVTPHRANAVSTVQYPLFSASDFKGIPHSHIAFLANAFAATDPTNFHQAKTDDGWIEVMNKELTTLKANKTWTLTSLPFGHTPITSKWSRMSNTSDKDTTFGDGAPRVGMQLRSSPKVSTSSLLVFPYTIINVPRELYSIDVAATFRVSLTTVDRMETLEALGSICNSIKVDHNNADVIPCKVSYADDSINLNVDESTRTKPIDQEACSGGGLLVLIRKSSDHISRNDFVDVVTIGITSLSEDAFTKETIRVEYEWRSPRCDTCKIFGHVHDYCHKKVVSPPIVAISNVVTPNAEKTNDGFQTVGKKKKRKGKSKSTNDGQFTGPSVKHNVRYEPKATTSAPMKGTTYVGYTSQSTPMLKTTGNSSKKDNLSMSNSFSALNEEEEDEENV
ncbi:retrovirus-related pol polyprotein from transposon TNT 1-94 [Tanacetum coccineum]